VALAPLTRRPLHHSWKVSPAEARNIQEQLRHAVVTQDRLGPVRRVAGIDVGQAGDRYSLRAAVALLSYPELELLDHAVVLRSSEFPYVPGLLSFREVPPALAALDRLTVRPDLLLCDGQGIAHPRRLGLASHLGLLADLPSIGVAKSRLLGTHGVLPQAKGSWVPLRDGDEQIGAVLRSRTGVRPIYVSVGHRISLATALAYVIGCLTRYRLPETTRWAHRLASGYRPRPA
jgi:deoxyribonuclease V